MDKKNIEAIYPLTPMQQILLLHAIQHPKQDLGFLQIQFDMRGTVDVIALKQAWQSLFNRHQVLRTAIYWEDLDHPLQVVLRQVAPIWQQLDWQQLTPEQQQQRLSKWYLEDQQQGLSLNQAPVMRLTLIQQAADQYHFVCSCHHILLDGWSGYLMIRELFQLYQAHLQGTAKQLPAAFNYQQYVNWIQQQSLESAKIFWQQQLKGLSKTTAWPIKIVHAKAVYAKQTQTMNRSLTKQLQQLCRQEKMTLNTFLQGIWSLLLDGYSEQQDIVFGITLSGRTVPLAGIERAIGMFMNVLPLRVKINHHDQLLPWLQSIAAQQAQISHYEYVTLSQIQTWCVTDIRSLFVFQNHYQADLLLNNDSLSLTNFESGLTSNYPLTIAIQPGEQLVFSIIYDTNYLSTEQVTKLLEDWQKLLTESIAQPQRQLFALLQQIEAMPLPPNRPVLPLSEKTFVAPQTPEQELLAGIWADVLDVERIGIFDNFFELGGHSLLATQVISRVRDTFSVELPLLILFKFPTISGLSKHLKVSRHDPSLPPITPLNQDEPRPLSFAQQRLWFLEQLEGNSATYNMPVTLRLEGQLNRAALEQSLQTLVQRHETLRTTFQTVDGQPQVVVSPAEHWSLNVIDWQDTENLINEEAQRPFDLSKGPLFRATLLQKSVESHILLLNMHHIISDDWSIGILNRELSICYQAALKGQAFFLPPLPIQYADYAHWQRQWLTGDVLEKQLNYWKKQLADAPALLELPTDYPRPAIQRFQGQTASLQLSPQLTEQLKNLSQQAESTLFMTLLAAFATLLSRYSGQSDLVIGSPIANRTHRQIESLIGFFVNTLALRIDLNDNPRFEELLRRVKQVALDAYAHQDIPFEKLVEELQPERNLSHSPLFQVMFALQNAPMEPLQLSELNLTPLKYEHVTAKFDLLLSMVETGQGLAGRLEYNTDLFEPATITRMVGHFQTLLEGIVKSPQQPIAELPLLTETESQQLIAWNNTATDYPVDQCIHQLFEAQVEKTPDAVAVVFQAQQLTYRELNNQANQLAHHLQALGVKPEVLVGICLERCLEMVIGLLGILKAGGAYLPLEPTYPTARLAFMLEDAGVGVLLTQSSLVSSLPKTIAQVVCLDTDIEKHLSTHNLDSGVASSNLAYVIYTSGSTGRPKGVAIEHRSTVALLAWSKTVFTSEQLAGVLASTSLNFDLSVFEIFVPLSWGGRVILVENALNLPTLSDSVGVTLVNTVPSAISELVKMNGVPASVQVVNLAGEPLSHQLVQQIYQIETVQQVFNLYGPSEDTTYSTFALIKKGEVPTIGHPIANTQIYILDTNDQPVPVGIPGELHIGGAGLAQGYFNHPELTQEKFISNPFSDEPEARLYKTGDLARYLPDGNIEYLGRIDNQVKIRGFRIELGEIEAMLGQHTAVQESVVTVHKDSKNDKRLVAYFVPNPGQVIETIELRRFLKDRLHDTKRFCAVGDDATNP
jgi:amino acid adenylation domain-containing protein